MKTTFTQEIVTQTMCFNLSVTQAKFLFDHEHLFVNLIAVGHVRDVEYDGMFGPYIFVTFNYGTGYRRALNEVKKIIRDALREAK